MSGPFGRKRGVVLPLCLDLRAALPTAGRYAEVAFGQTFPSRAGDRIRTGDVQLGKLPFAPAKKLSNPVGHEHLTPRGAVLQRGAYRRVELRTDAVVRPVTR